MERDALTGRRPVKITQANAYLGALEKQFYRASAEVRFERSRPESIRLMKRVAKMGGGAASADVQPPIDVVLEEIDWKQSHGRLASDPRFNLGLTGKEKKDEPKSEFA